MRALVFERDPAAAGWLAAALTGRGHEPTATSDAAEALRLFRSTGHELVILDWMSDASPELCRAIRDWPGRPVILASGLSDAPAELESALHAGADDLLPKMADAGQLLARLAVASGQVSERQAWASAAREQQAAIDKARREGEERYTLAARAASDGLWSWD